MMSDRELWCVGLVFAILIVVTALETLHWLPKGRAKFVILFVAGVSMMAVLRAANIPPDWFDGGKEGFGIAVTLLLWAFVTRGPSERSFGVPLLTGMGGTLVALNFYAHL
jgi:hypothetical protein